MQRSDLLSAFSASEMEDCLHVDRDGAIIVHLIGLLI